MEINKGKKIRPATIRNAKRSSLGIKKKMIPNKNLDLQKEKKSTGNCIYMNIKDVFPHF